MFHIPETLTMKTGDIVSLVIGAFCIGVAIVCFIWLDVNAKESSRDNDRNDLP